MKKITIVGGGITGLSAAFYLHQELQKQSIEAEITVSEASDTFGGRIHTREREGFIFEKGPDSFLARKMAIIDLVRDLGIEEELVGTNPAKKKNYIMHRNHLYTMPEGMVMGIPSKIKPFIASDLISISGKMRAMLDFFKPARKAKGDESLGHFMERRLGKEVLYRVAEPLLSGIYAGDTYRLSIQATFPQFAQMEREHGSLIRATMKSSQKQKAAQGQGKGPSQGLPGIPPAAGKSMFISFRKGLKTLINKLTDTLTESNVKLRPNRKLISLTQRADADGKGYLLTYEDGMVEYSDAVILTLPTPHAAQLFGALPIARQLSQIEYVSVANIVLAYRRSEVNYPFDGSGFVVPRGENRFITACTWTSEKWLHSSPRDYVLLRCYIGRAGQEEWKGMSEEEIIRRVRKDIYETMGFDNEPLFTEVTKLYDSMPQYDVGHLDRVAEIRSELHKVMPHVWITGAAFHGVGVPDCIRQGKEMANQVAGQLVH